MAFDTERKQYSKENFKFVEIEVGGIAYRFCEDRGGIPAGLTAQPTLKSVSISPAKINLEGGLGQRGKMNVTIKESMDYTEWGTLQNPVRFWSRWRAENPYYKDQGRLSYFSGYIVNNEYLPENFVRRDYIIESFGQKPDRVKFVGKDPLKLADNERAQAPAESNGALIADINDTVVDITLTPAGVSAEYPAIGVARIGDELVDYAKGSGDNINFFNGRGQYGTTPEAHSEGDKFQVCLVYNNATPSNIDFDLLTNYANVDAAIINKPEWDAESASSFTTTYSAIITEPTGVSDLIKEFAESAPHYLYWDDRVNLIQFVALKPPPETAQLLTFEGNLLADSVAVEDRQDLRKSTVIYHFGQRNPTREIDEKANYAKSYVRIDPTSLANYGQNAIKRVYSRWIDTDNKTAAVLAGARIGRRFSEAPREITFTLDAKDADTGVGDNVLVKTDLVEKVGGGDFPELFYQILQSNEGRNYEYLALEHTYGPAVPGDEDAEDPNVRTVYLAGELNQLDGGRNLRDVYEDVFGLTPPEPQFDVRFIFETSCVAGSSTNLSASVRTGTWPELTTPILIDNRGLIVGKGGNGERVGGTGGEVGGVALQLDDDIRLDNLGIIGGGGGGGKSVEDIGTINSVADGGGGAGFFNGTAGTGTFTSGAQAVVTQAQPGTNTDGGDGGFASNNEFPEPTIAQGGDGGDLGQSGGGSGGFAPGDAIQTNGNTITYINAGDIRGAIT